MLVKELMTQSVAFCEPDDALDAAAEQMWHRDCGALPVCDAQANQVVGMVTDRDICMHSHFHHQSLDQLSVADAMTREPKICKAEDSIVDAEQVMRQAYVRRVPVVNDEGGLVGIITLADIAKEAAREGHRESPRITQTEVADTLSTICQPHLPAATAA